MNLYQLASLIIKCILISAILFLGIELWRGYRSVQIQAFSIYTNPAYYDKYLHEIDTKGLALREPLLETKNSIFNLGELFSYDYKGTKFLIKSDSTELTAETSKDAIVLVDIFNFKNYHQEILEDSSDKSLISYDASSEHWLAFLFGGRHRSITIQEIVEDYIPNQKWVSKDSPFAAQGDGTD